MTNILIERLTNVFGAPDHAGSIEAYVAEIGRITDGFGADALDRAASFLISTGGKSWPAPKAIVEACADAQQALALRNPQKPKTVMPWELDEERAREWARDFCRTTELGRNAFDDGYGRQVYYWAQSYARECLRKSEAPSLEARPQKAEIDHWFRYCRVPSRKHAHPHAKNVVDHTELERAACLNEPLSPETSAHIGAKLGQLLKKTLRTMPVEDEAI